MKSSAKAFFYCGVITLLLFLYYLLLRMRNENILSNETFQVIEILNKLKKKTNNKILNLKYILVWTSTSPLSYIGTKQDSFKERNCPYTNCYVTTNRSYLQSYTKFDVIAFSGNVVMKMNKHDLPYNRSAHQKYVFATMESSYNYPVCSKIFDNFFNWTWTYRLDSDAEWGYIIVKDSEKKVIGPKLIMNWIKLEDMKPIDTKIKEKLLNKTRTAAWFVSNCNSIGDREIFVNYLQMELIKFGHKVDIYGRCGFLNCSRNDQDMCNSMIEKDYYFYLSFENSLAEDYVSEKILYPLQHLTVPIVYGGANYTRFMADGIYINARELGPQKLAEKMNELIKNPDQYANYFKWINYYSYHKRSESVESDDVCRFCEMLNQEETVKKSTVYQNFRKWWNPPHLC